MTPPPQQKVWLFALILSTACLASSATHLFPQQRNTLKKKNNNKTSAAVPHSDVIELSSTMATVFFFFFLIVSCPKTSSQRARRMIVFKQVQLQPQCSQSRTFESISHFTNRPLVANALQLVQIWVGEKKIQKNRKWPCCSGYAVGSPKGSAVALS